jgi:hypothetical protein
LRRAALTRAAARIAGAAEGERDDERRAPRLGALEVDRDEQDAVDELRPDRVEVHQHLVAAVDPHDARGRRSLRRRRSIRRRAREAVREQSLERRRVEARGDRRWLAKRLLERLLRRLLAACAAEAVGEPRADDEAEEERQRDEGDEKHVPRTISLRRWMSRVAGLRPRRRPQPSIRRRRRCPAT